MKIALLILTLVLDIVPSGKAFLEQLQKRDSILIADQLEYGFVLEGVKGGTEFALPDFSALSGDTLTLVRPWKIDTLKVNRKKGLLNIRGSVVLAPFEAGKYELPPLFVLRRESDRTDTLVFDPAVMEVKTIQVDTASFVIHDIKGQITYPIGFADIWPIAAGLLLLAAVVVLVWWLVCRHRRIIAQAAYRDPPHITALRELDKYRSDKYWAPERQKAFYSGVTDTLKTYMGARFAIDAPEMTTSEVFDALKDEKAITPDLYVRTRELFERADFVKFAKHTASDEENASVLPLAVSFVTSTYQQELEEEHVDNEL